MFSATFPRAGREPLHIGLRAVRANPQILSINPLHRRAVTNIFLFIECDISWYHLRCSCCQIFVFWSDPTAIQDPPVAIAFGPDPLSEGSTFSDDS